MGAAEKLFASLEDYFSLEENAKEKYEYIDGQIVAMAGGTAKHAHISANITRALATRLDDKPCIVYSSDVKVRTEFDFMYPDVTVVCGEEIFGDEKQLALTNPKLLVEVLSESTERYDRGLKFSKYRSIASLQQYVLVSQDMPWVETFCKAEDGSWVFTDAKGVESTIYIKALDLSLPLGEVYRKVSFGEQKEERE